jgi:hypothetical protein
MSLGTSTDAGVCQHGIRDVRHNQIDVRLDVRCDVCQRIGVTYV